MHRRLRALAIVTVFGLVAPVDAQDITSNLGAHWKLIETGGTTAVDNSSNVNHGVYTNGVVLANSSPVPSDGAVAARFDGVNDYVAIPNEWLYDSTGASSIAVWFKVNAFTSSDQTIVAKGDTTSWRIHRDLTNNGVALTCRGLTVTKVASTKNVNDGNWHHVVGVFTGSQLRIYVDGVLSNSASSIGFISTNNLPVNIGRSPETAGREFNGWIYDVRFYGRVLSATDVSYLYLMGGPAGHWKLAETSGTSAADSSLHGSATGTVSGAANWSTQCTGVGAFDFNGSTNYVSIPSATQLQPTGALTLAAWVRGDAWGAADDVDVILRKGEGNPNNYQLAIAGGRVALYLDDSDAVGIRGNTVLATGVWYHVAATWDGANVRIYVNGQLDNTPTARSGTIATDARPLYLGGYSGSDQFDGLIRDARLYWRALSASEIVKLYGFIGYWKFSEGTGVTAADSSGLANNATLNAGASWITDCAGNKAMQTNGVSGAAQTASAFTPPDAGTVTFWMRSNGNPAVRSRLCGLGGDWEIRQEPDGTLSFDLCGEGGTDFVTTSGLSEVGRWYHVAAVFDSANDSYSVYIDGQLQKSGVNTNPMSPQAADILSFGVRTGAAEYWAGALRDFRVYNRPLCPTEIAELYGLVGHWKLDETSGATAADSSGFGRPGTVIGAATWSTGKVDRSLLLNGASRVEVNSLMGKPKNVTLAGWANLTAADSAGSELISLGDYFAIRLNATSTTSRAFFYNGTTWVAVSANQVFAGAGWHHFAAVFNDDADVCKFFIDGVEAASLATTVSIPYAGSGSKVVLGSHGNAATTFDFTGKIDDLRIYNRALCPTEVQVLSTMGGAGYSGVRILRWVETP